MAGGEFAVELFRPAVGEQHQQQPLGKLHRGAHRLGEPPAHRVLDDQTIDDDLDGVLLVLVKFGDIVTVHDIAIDANPYKALAADPRQQLLMPAFSFGDQGRKEDDLRPLFELHQAIDHILHRLGGNFAAADMAMGMAAAGEQQAQVIVDLGDRPHRRAGVLAGGLLLDGHGGRQALQGIDIRLVHLAEKLPRIGGKGLDIAPLPFGIERIEGQGRLPRSGDAGEHHQAVAGQVDIDVLEVVHPRPTDAESLRFHETPVALGRHRRHRDARLKKIGVIHLDAAVHDHQKAPRPGQRGGFLVDDALLHPDGLRQGREAQGLFDDGKYIGGVSENIDDIDLTGHRRQRRVAGQAEDLVLAGVDRVDPVAGGEKISGHHIAGAIFLRRKADHRDIPGRFQEFYELRGGLQRGYVLHRRFSL